MFTTNHYSYRLNKFSSFNLHWLRPMITRTAFVNNSSKDVLERRVTRKITSTRRPWRIKPLTQAKHMQEMRTWLIP